MTEETQTNQTFTESIVAGYDAQPNTEEMQLFDAEAAQRFEFEVKDGGVKYQTAHVFKPLTDERYKNFIGEVSVKLVNEKIETDYTDALISLWNDTISEVENIEVEAGQDWKNLISENEKIKGAMNLLAVIIIEPETIETGKRKLGQKTQQIVVTEAYLNDTPVQQTHTLVPNNIELLKRYDRIQAKRLKEEKIGGLRKKPKVKIIPQDEAIGELYDEMLIQSTGFKSATPLRFKTRVVQSIFELEIEEKK